MIGASGSGVSTLGAVVADLLAAPHLDADTVYWRPTDPPFVEARPRAERLALLCELLPAAGCWVFSGSAIDWAAALESSYDLIVYLRLDPAIRMDRLRRREQARYGRRIEPGGDMAATNAAFLAWAAAYDTAGAEQRSRVAHEEWLAARATPILRLDSSEPVDVLASAVLSKVKASGLRHSN
ncbi:hypothetical protein IY145_07405 [Methylosinus sp. H3A]|uniref:hypothetical protein n=1 Tax=Methylosinus sp. H3A TaxID=2785786 RepID=UPI0018C306A0|nr:hypothetical protein [Methylosinus sp. H3A]MBG0809200.1 hypothetical protein [Methylosinus sp. H3A]